MAADPYLNFCYAARLGGPMGIMARWPYLIKFC